MHYRIFDAWRLTAAMLVMAYHFLYFSPGGPAGVLFLHRLLPLLDMFFMISGFLIATRYAARLTGPASYLDFLRRRIARLYPLHLATLLLFAGIGAAVAAGLVGTQEPERWDFRQFPVHLLALHALGFSDHLAFNYVSWSVSAEFFCYALFPLVVAAARRLGLPGLVLLLTLWIAGLEVASARGVFPQGSWLDADTLGAWRAFADFVIGAIVAHLAQRRVLDIRSHGTGVVLILMALESMILGWSGRVSLVLLAAAMLATALAETARPDSTRALAVLDPLSRVSFGIYLIHPVMEALFLSVLWNRWLGPLGAVDFHLFVAMPMLATLLLAVLSERLLERPAAAWLTGGGAARRGRGDRAGSAA